MTADIDPMTLMKETRARMAEKSKSRGTRKKLGSKEETSEKTDVLPREIEEPIPSETTGWWRKGGPAHWIQDGKPLCGREMPYDFRITSADPDDPNYQTNQCRSCRKALDRNASQAFADALAQTFRVRVRATGIEGTVPSGQVNSNGTVSVRYDTNRHVAGVADAKFLPSELEVLPPLTMGDRVIFPHKADRPATIVGDYSDEGNHLLVKLEYEDGEKGGGHVGNMLRFVEPGSTQETESESPEGVAPALTPAELPGTPVLLPGLQLVPWDRIRPSKLNPRKQFDEEALKELAASIYAKGLQQNLVVRPHPTEEGLYEIAAGERRYRAIGLLTEGLNLGTVDRPEWAELPTDHPVPVLVRTMTDLELLETATAENVQRRRMTPLEEADAFAALIDHGATPKEVATKFGYAQRTVVRRVQISKGLAPQLREDFNAGKLSLAQAEVLAPLGPETQAAVWGNFRRNPEMYDAAHIRKHLSTFLFQVKHAQFPRHWYTGEVSADDLFGDVPQHFMDPKQALELQLKHARHLADKDVEQGAPFADVILGGFAEYLYSGRDGQGVAYAINTTTGEMRRYENLAPRKSWAAKPEYTAQGRDAHATTQEPTKTYGKGDLRFEGPAQQPSPVQYPKPIEASRSVITGLLVEKAVTDEHLFNALFVADCLVQEYAVLPLPGVSQAMTLVHEVGIEENEEFFYDRLSPKELIGHLMTLPADAVKVLAQAFMAAQVESALGGNTYQVMELGAAHGHPFKLTSEYLKACSKEALEEIWDDAGMGDRDNTSPQYLRSMLLEEADRLAAEGFLPRPLRPEPLEDLEEEEGD